MGTNNKNKVELPKLGFGNIMLNLTADAVEFLSGQTNGTSNFALFHYLLTRMATQTSVVSRRGVQVSLPPGQAEVAMSDLEAIFGIKRKQATNLFNKMEQLNLIRRHSDTLTTLCDFVCVSGWFANKQRSSCPYYLYRQGGASISTTPLKVAANSSQKAQNLPQSALNDENQPIPPRDEPKA